MTKNRAAAYQKTTIVTTTVSSRWMMFLSPTKLYATHGWCLSQESFPGFIHDDGSVSLEMLNPRGAPAFCDTFDATASNGFLADLLSVQPLSE